jgi:DNA-binding transcriptional MerR regulator
MRMAELSAESGVPVATIKYYLREGLLSPGELTSPNQARYDRAHARRLKLVRALLDVGGLSIADVREVVEAVDERAPTHNILGIAQHGLSVPKAEVDEEGRAWALARIRAIADRREWEVDADDVSTKALVSVLCTFRELGQVRLLDRIERYAELADGIAEVDLATIGDLPTTESIVESAVVGTVLGDALLAALRRLAQQHASRKLLGDDTSASPSA